MQDFEYRMSIPEKLSSGLCQRGRLDTQSLRQTHDEKRARRCDEVAREPHALLLVGSVMPERERLRDIRKPRDLGRPSAAAPAVCASALDSTA